MSPDGNKKTLIDLVVGARPNFMKVAPLYHRLVKTDWCRPRLVHTGQHYDYKMSAAFIADLNLPEPDFYLGVGSGHHGEQTAKALASYEKIILESPPSLLIVVGDVNSTIACALAAKKLNLPVAHLEAGLRSFDRTMPEEINRVLTDAISDVLWTPSPDADENLIKEGIPGDRIHRVGNIMIDSLKMMQPKIDEKNACHELGIDWQQYGIITLHRPQNVDFEEQLSTIVAELVSASELLPFVFPVHPRTLAKLQQFDLIRDFEETPNIRLVEPLSYLMFMNLLCNSKLAVTDSGGIQEETTYLGIPCLTMRPNTERPITISMGTNKLISYDQVYESVRESVANHETKRDVPELWDGRTASRVVDHLKSEISLLQ